MEPDCIEITLDEIKTLDEEFEKYFIEAVKKQKCFNSEIKCEDEVHINISWLRIKKFLERSTNENVRKWYSLLQSFSDLSRKADKDYDLYFNVMEWPCYGEFEFKIEKYKDLLNSGLNESNVAKITKTQRELLLKELENCSKELFSVYISKAQRNGIWNSIAKNLNSWEQGPILSVIEWQKIWLDIKFNTELRERRKLLGTAPEDMRILNICRITSIEECEIMKGLESYNEFGVDTDHLKCECCELLKNTSGTFRLCYACSKTNLVICDICLIKPSSKVYSTKSWSSTAKKLIPPSINNNTLWVCNACKTSLLEQASLNWKICRLCAQESESFTPINNSFLSEFGREFNIVFKQKLVFGLGLPSTICTKCFEQFESTKRFYHDMKKNQVTLFHIHKNEFIGKTVRQHKSLLEKLPKQPIGKMAVANSKLDMDAGKANETLKQNESCIRKLCDGQIGNTSIRKIKVKTVTSLNAEIPQDVLTTTCSISGLKNTTHQFSENVLDKSLSMMISNNKIFETSSKYIANEHILPTPSQSHSFDPKRSKANPKCQEIDSSSKTFPPKTVLVRNQTDLKKDITAQQTPDAPSPDKCTENSMSQNLLYQSSIPLSDKPPDKIKEHKAIQLIKTFDDSLSTQQAPQISDCEKNTRPLRRNTLYQLKRVTVSKKPYISMLVKTGFNIIKEEQETNNITSAIHPKTKHLHHGNKKPKRAKSKLKKATNLKEKEPDAKSIVKETPFTFYQPYSLDESDTLSAPERITSSPCPYTPSNENKLEEKNPIESKNEVCLNTFSIIKSPSQSSSEGNKTSSIGFNAFDEIKTEEVTTPVVQFESTQVVETASNSEKPLNAALAETSKNELFECYLSENQAGKCDSEINQLLNRPGVKSFIFNSSTKPTNVLIARNDTQVFPNPFEMEVDQEKVTNPFIASIFDGLVDIKEELSETDPLGGVLESGEDFNDEIESALYECEEIKAPLIPTDCAVNKNGENEDETLQTDTCETARKQANTTNTLKQCATDMSSSTKEEKSTVGNRKTNVIDKTLKHTKKIVKNKKKKVLKSKNSKEPRRSLRIKITS